MFLNTESQDPWVQTVALLSLISLPKEELVLGVMRFATRQACRADRSSSSARWLSADVHVIERLSACTAAISWHDATSCNYESQIWRAGIARAKGRCAMTGQTIKRGDGIYRPIGQPANAGAMIRSNALQAELRELAA